MPRAAWEARHDAAPIEPASLASEGFVHCTDGADELIATANRHYAADPQPFVALSIDLDTLAVAWRYDVPGSPYPHVYGPIAAGAIAAVAALRREPGGRFIGLDETEEVLAPLTRAGRLGRMDRKA
ncbi:MAG TPA: DUF952 domain-containing protein [Candidatus Limnocylindrales bacterium]|nr:DUF952 domain-containing protein [Candidatus Limnocylindrales bacterium]